MLVTGANGQLGSELTEELRRIFGIDNVVASDISIPLTGSSAGPFEKLDVLDIRGYEDIIDRYQITQIYHLAALLSANAEKNIDVAWTLNMDGLLNTLYLAKKKSIDKIFWPSSIAVFGPDAQKNKTPQQSPCNPTTVYGITKLAGEQWCAYYHHKFGLDVRSIRYPGLIGYKSLPGGGTTDYAVDIFHKAVAGEAFTCFLNKDSALPMMYMKDAVKATLELMKAPKDKIAIRSSYNVSAISFTPDEIAKSILRRMPDFEIIYTPDYRQDIASSWPDSIRDTEARRDWNWSPDYDLDRMTDEILQELPRFSEQQ